MTISFGCWQREDICIDIHILPHSPNSISTWSRYLPRSGHGLGWSIQSTLIDITGDWSEPQTERRGPGLKLSWRQVVAMPYTLMKLPNETLCNFPTSRKKISDLSTAVNIVTSILHSLHSGLRIGLMKRCWAQRYRSYLRDGRVGSFLLSVNPFHHGCSFVFSFVFERSRAGPACWRAQCVVACLFWCSLQHTREFSSAIAESAWNISGRHWRAFCGIYFDRADSERPEESWKLYKIRSEIRGEIDEFKVNIVQYLWLFVNMRGRCAT